MRRLSFNRPNEKVRNPKRHIRSLKRWAKGFEGFYPERTGDLYQNFKIWTLDRLIEGPKSKLEWKQEAIRQLLQVAENLIKAKPESENGKSGVAVLLCHPNLWSSEVTVFFDKEYLDSFIPTEPNGKSILSQNGVSIPNNFTEAGYIATWNDEDENGEEIVWSEERYTIYEKTITSQSTSRLRR
ncbi:DUF3916 domain-containing protein [Idiomarina sp.]|uniref:DUF3916 domain-containing protein n=1 Tax=Idiomarina sp. TaxID=1874361 RepID=UPI003A8F6D39